MQVSSTMNCCGTYQMTGLYTPPTKEALDLILTSLKQSGNGKLPVIVVFSDATGKASPDHQAGGGDAWAAFLRKEGYHVDEIELGKNPKSYNYLKFFMWFAHKDKKVSKRTVFLRSKKNENESTSVTGSSDGLVGGTRRSRVGRLFGR